MHHKVAADIAVPLSDYPHIPDWLTLIDAMRVVKARGWEVTTLEGRPVIPRAVLVFNQGLEFVGVVRRRDIMRGLIGGHAAGLRQTFGDAEIDPDAAELSYDRSVEEMRKRGDRLVKEVMIPITTINHDAHLVKALHQMVKFNTSLLAVVKDGKVIGAVRSVDILLEVERALGIEKDPKAG
jgi:CBS domain-containing protein